MEGTLRRILIPLHLLAAIRAHGESSYPEESAGFLLGTGEGIKRVRTVLAPANARTGDRTTRYLIKPEDYLQAEATAEDSGHSLIGVFHSHPDQPDRPSEYDREWALPNLSYVITEVDLGRAVGSRCWLLTDDRSSFLEETIDT